MRIRIYRPADLSAIATIMADNNHTDALARFITRDITKYPSTYRKGCLRFLKAMLLGKGTVCFVAETDASSYDNDTDTDNGPEVVAWAIWTRIGSSPKALEWQRTLNGSYTDTLNRFLTALESHYYRIYPFTYTEHTFHHAHYNAIRPLLHKPWDKSVFSEAWELNCLYTHSLYQCRGIGTTLINWGKERAREENVPVVVVGSPVGGIAYKKAGFENIGEIGLGREGGFDELEFGGRVMRRWCWEPSGVGRWVERAREKLGATEMETREVEEVVVEGARGSSGAR